MASVDSAINDISNPTSNVDAAAITLLQEDGWSVSVLDQVTHRNLWGSTWALGSAWCHDCITAYDPPADILEQAYRTASSALMTREIAESAEQIDATSVSEMRAVPTGNSAVLLGSRVVQTATPE